MRILAFADLHGSKVGMRKIEEKSKFADILISAGDHSIFEQNMKEIMGKLDNLGKTVLMIHGNHESETVLKGMCKHYTNIEFLHEKIYRVDNYVFLGYGGGGFALEDPRFTRWAESIIPQLRKEDKIILITHAPPHKTKLDLIWEEHCGNKSIRRFIDLIDVHLLICGHLHENAGKEDKVKKTHIINPGPYGKLIEL